MIELSDSAAQAAPGVMGILIALVALIFYRREKIKVDAREAIRADAQHVAEGGYLSPSRKRCLKWVADGSPVLVAPDVEYLVEHGYVEVRSRWLKEPWYVLTPKGEAALKE
jgi:hypothetical protein